MRIIVFIIGIGMLGLPGIALAGADNASLECTGKYNNGVISLTGSVPGDLAEFDKGVFTVAATEPDRRNLLLYAIPKSVQAQGGARRNVKASFDAILMEAPKPGYKGPINYYSLIREVPLHCTFKHEV
jgi:hypothetical protein